MIGNFLKIYNAKLGLVYVRRQHWKYTNNIITTDNKNKFFGITLKGKDRIKQVLVY